MKRSLAFALALVMVLSLLPATAMAEETGEASVDVSQEIIAVDSEDTAVYYSEDSVLSIGDSITLTLDSGEEKYYTIIPEKDCSLLVYMPNGEPTLDPEYNLWYTPHFSFTLHTEDYSQSGLTISTEEYCGARMDMVAGQTYSLCVRNSYMFHSFSGTFRVEEKPEVERIALTKTDISTTVGSSVSIDSKCAPELAFGTVSWTISDESIAAFEWYGEQACSVKLLAPGVVTVTAVTPNGISASCVITASEAEPITIGESRTITLTPESEISYVFTADEDCEIVAYTPIGDLVESGNGDYFYRPCFSLMVSSENGVASHYLNTEHYMGNKYFVKAGETYTFTVTNYNEIPLTSEVFLRKPDAIESLTLKKVVLNGTSGSVLYMKPIAEPETAFATFDWSSSDYNVVDFDMLDYAFCFLMLRDPGTAVVTATATNGMTISCTVNVSQMEEISLGETKTLTLGSWESVTYVYTPRKDGAILAYMPGGEYRYDEYGNGFMTSYSFFMYLDDYSQWSVECDIPGYTAATIDAVADQNYYLCVSNYSGKEMTGTFCLAESVNPQKISITDSNSVVSVGGYVYAQIAPVPEISIDTYSWTVSDPTIISAENSTGTYFSGTALKAGTVTLTVTSGTGLTASKTITVSEAELISCGETKTVTVPAGGSERFLFCCEESGYYVFYTSDVENGGIRPVISVDDQFYGSVSSNGYSVSSCYMEAGSQYTLLANNPYETDIDATLTFAAAKDPTAIEMSGKTLSCYVGDYVDLVINADSPLAVTEYTWSSGDESVFAPVMQDSNLCEFHAAKAGMVTVTVTHRNGLSDVCQVTVLDVPEIRPGEAITETLAYGEYVKYSFTPEADGKYGITTPIGAEITTNEGEITTADFYCYLVDSDMFWVEQEFGVTEGVSYVTAELSAGKTYYVMVCNDVDTDESITGTVCVVSYDPAHEHQYYAAAGTDPSCTEKGRVIYNCSVCGDSYTEELDALGHEYGAWISIREADCTAAGEQRRDCGRCDHYETQTIDKLEHVFVDGFCTLCGIGEDEAKLIPGDADGNGVVDNVDAMLVLQYAVGLNNGAALNLDVCDVDGNGVVDNVDAMLILQYAVGLIQSFLSEK